MLLSVIVSVGSEIVFTDRDDDETTGLLCVEQATIMAPWRHGLAWLLVGLTPKIQGQLLTASGTQVTVHICDFYPAEVENDDDLIMVAYVERVERSLPF